MVVPLSAGSAAELRASLRSMLRRQGADRAVAEAVVLAVQEAFNNAAASQSHAVDVVASVCRGSVWVEVRDKGRGFDQSRLAGPDLRCEHGRGIYLMQELMDTVSIRSGRSGTTVLMAKGLRACPGCTSPRRECPQATRRRVVA